MMVPPVWYHRYGDDVIFAKAEEDLWNTLITR